jgi:phosphopantothenoylcysteine decarboxylase/phosphopantothenate--cysteine ligase
VTASDVVVMVAAVADYRPVAPAERKIKKDSAALTVELEKTDDILAGLAAARGERILVGFAAETDDLIANAEVKLAKKGADWIVANDVSPEGGVMGGAENTVHILRASAGNPTVEDWPKLAKDEVAERLVAQIVKALPA